MADTAVTALKTYADIPVLDWALQDPVPIDLGADLAAARDIVDFPTLNAEIGEFAVGQAVEFAQRGAVAAPDAKLGGDEFDGFGHGLRSAGSGQMPL